MNAEDFIELAEYLKENYVSKDGSLTIQGTKQYRRKT